MKSPVKNKAALQAANVTERYSRGSRAIRPRRSRDGSLNHPVRAQHQRLRDRNAERLGGLQIDDQLELRRLLDGKVGWLRALEDLVHVCGGASDEIGPVHRI